MSKQRIHNEWFQKLVKTTCPCGQKKTQVFAWGQYIRAKWNTVDHFCAVCFEERVVSQIINHADGCGCQFSFQARAGHGPLPEWLKPPTLCAA